MNGPGSARNLLFFACLFLACMGYVMFTLADLQINRHEELFSKAQDYSQMQRRLVPARGKVLDCRGEVLAASEPLFDVYIDLSLGKRHASRLVPVLSPLLKLSPVEMEKRYLAAALVPESKTNHYRRAWLARPRMPLTEWTLFTNQLHQSMFGFDSNSATREEKWQLNQLRHESVFANFQQGRSYPLSNTLCHVLGFASPTNNSFGLRGVTGIEASCEPYLAGVPGEIRGQQNASGRELIYRREHRIEPVDGSNVVLTIDIRAQQIVEAVLAEAMREEQPRLASAIVLQVKTGAILAWASMPGYFPGNPRPSTNIAWRNHALMDQMEPGSIMKIFTLAAALQAGITSLDREIDCEFGHARVGGVSVHDEHPHGVMTLSNCFAKSSNIAHAKLANALGSDRFEDFLELCGFGKKTGVRLPFESDGWLPSQPWGEMKLSRVSFGQGFAVTQLQMALGLAAMGNDGMLMHPMLIQSVESADGQTRIKAQPRPNRRIVSPSVARQVLLALSGVVDRGGTGRLAATATHTTCGKTGTAQKSDKDGYLEGKYYASFVGLVPATQPELCIAVAVDEPQNKYYGGIVCAPLFRAIAEQLVVLMNIPPDKGTASAALPQGAPAGKGAERDMGHGQHL